MLADRSKEVSDAYDEAAKGSKSMRVSERKTDFNAYRTGQEAGDRADLGQSRIGTKKELD